jgi:hypothetical protein
LLEYKLATGVDAHPKVEDLAAPHRAPYASLRDRILNKPIAAVEASVKQLAKGSEIYENALNNVTADKSKNDYHKLSSFYGKTREMMEERLAELKSDPQNEVKRRSLVKAVNNLASNAPGYGPHQTVNNPVSNRLHLNLAIKVRSVQTATNEPLTPRSNAARASLPGIKTATTNNKTSLVHSTGETTSVPHSISSSDREDVNVRNTVVRGSLAVKNGILYKPNNINGWIEVT